ncbi:MAG TPA: hypothetical protein VFR75_09465 [Solirubrobacterales bacterium]|nr:hypothetical protein [Solirubrobacterales bacterium]
MAVMLPRERWSDDRLDQFEKRVDERFDRVEADIRELRGIMIGGFVTLLAAMIGMNAF